MKNKKLIATVASLCLVVVAVVAAVVGVLAASQQNVAGNFRVAYTANDVSAVVTLDKKEDAASPAYTGEPQSHEFVKSANTSTETLTFGNVSLSVSKKYVVYKFTFQNKNTAYGMDITSTYTYAAASNENVDVYYAWGATEPSVEYTNEIATVSNGTALIASGNLGGVQTAAKVGTGDTVTLYIIVAIHDLNADAHYELGASGENTLVFNLTRHDVAPSA